MARLFLVVAALVALFAAASAAPCIECKDCTTDNCRRQCKATCPPQFDINDCRRKGADIGKNKVVGPACKTTETYCNGGKPPSMTRSKSSGSVTFLQCQNIAYGECQNYVMNTRNVPCSRGLSTGMYQCNKSEFTNFYKGEAYELCKKEILGTIPY